MISYDSEAILLSDLVMNRLMHYHRSGFITDEEYFKLERKGSVDSVTKYLNKVADKKLVEMKFAEMEDL